MAIVIAAPGPTDFSHSHALILDPYLTNRRLLRDTLNALGCGAVYDTGQVPEALRMLEQGGINSLFLDWSGEVDALAILRTLRAPSNPQRYLPVVVMTAYSGLDHVAAARDAGANEFMLRPWSSEVVASRLRGLVQRPRLFIQGGAFFGPDRRRRHQDWRAPERRRHENWRSGDRRQGSEGGNWNGPERRQGRPGFEPLERRTAPRA